MILTGQYDSPFVRRVAISLKLLGFANFKHDKRSVFGDFDAMRMLNPLARIPSLTLDSGEVLIDSNAILDWLDREVGPARALTPSKGKARTNAMQTIALACGAIEKFGAVNYERIIRPEPYRWDEWIERCDIQARGALATLEKLEWEEKPLDQVQITTGCLLGYLALTRPDVLAAYSNLSAFWARCCERPEFAATRVGEYAVPHG
jgi:glutathione S-transferase